MRSKRSFEGYLQIDHRNSPGLAPGFMEGLGLKGPSVGAGQNYESPTIQCCHCGVTVILNALRTRARGHCFKCDDYVCDSPACNAECRPLAKLMDGVQEAAAKGQVITPRLPGET